MPYQGHTFSYALLSILCLILIKRRGRNHNSPNPQKRGVCLLPGIPNSHAKTPKHQKEQYTRIGQGF